MQNTVRWRSVRFWYICHYSWRNKYLELLLKRKWCKFRVLCLHMYECCYSYQFCLKGFNQLLVPCSKWKWSLKKRPVLLVESSSPRRLYLIEPWFSYRVLFSFKDDRWLGTSSLPPLCMEVDMSVPIEFKGAAKQPATAHCKFLWISVRLDSPS